jgi:hypothetical protein
VSASLSALDCHSALPGTASNRARNAFFLSGTALFGTDVKSPQKARFTAGWNGTGALTPINRFATMFSGEGIQNANGTEWYFPQRLTDDTGAVDNGNANPAQSVLDVDATMVRGTKMSIAASWHRDVAIATGKTATPCPWIDGKGSKSSALTKCHPEWMPT